MSGLGSQHTADRQSLSRPTDLERGSYNDAVTASNASLMASYILNSAERFVCSHLLGAQGSEEAAVLRLPSADEGTEELSQGQVTCLAQGAGW